MKRCLFALCGLGLLAGCLPIDLDVTGDGRVVIPRSEGVVYYDPGTGKVTPAMKTGAAPVFAVAVPNRGGIVTVTTDDAGNMGRSFTLHYVNKAGKAKQLHAASNVTYVQVSPTGDHVSFTRVADGKAQGFDENLPELHVISLSGGGAKKIADAVGTIHRWSADGKALHVVELDSKIAETDLYRGKLMKVDPESGKGDALANLIGQNPMHMDVSPQGDQALFTAAAASAAGEKLKDPDMGQNNNQKPATGLFAVDIKAGTVKLARDEASFGMFSPNQTKVLIGATDGDGMSLIVTDLQFTNDVTVATDVAAEAGAQMNSVKVYPDWYNDKTVLYIAKRPVFGTAAENYMLTTVSADGKQKKIHQPAIDAALTHN